VLALQLFLAVAVPFMALRQAEQVSQVQQLAA